MGLDRGEIIGYLQEESADVVKGLFDSAYRTKLETVGEKVYLRGLVEISNICRKNCLYCGIRSGNPAVSRYELSEDEVLDAAKFALEAGYGSLVIQGGERHDKEFVTKISRLVSKIKSLSEQYPLGITLSLGEQPREVYREWFEASGTVRRNRMSDFDSIRANGKIAMKLDEGDSLVSVLPCNENQDVFLATYRGRAIRFPVPEIRIFAGTKISQII